MPKAIVLLSGGLDSVLVLHVLRRQGIDILALNAVTIFSQTEPGKNRSIEAARAAEFAGVPLKTLDLSEGLMALVKNPEHGHGKNVNPCIDCRIMMLGEAKQLMPEVGADFVATGEVVGQRPMSQRRDIMRHIDRKAGMLGVVLRPLCAKLLEPTIPENEGLVDREKLLDFQGRTRKPQMALAAELGITEYPNPAGGCLLTDPQFAHRMKDLLDHPEAEVNDVKLLKHGRHFRLDDQTKLVVGRDAADNEEILALAQERDVLLQASEFTGPAVLLRGEASAGNLALAAGITLRYGKARSQPSAEVDITRRGCDEVERLRVAPMAQDELEKYSIILEKGKGA